MSDETREPEQNDEATTAPEGDPEEFEPEDLDPEEFEPEDLDPENLHGEELVPDDAEADDVEAVDAAPGDLDPEPFDPATFDPEDFASAEPGDEEVAVAVQSFWEAVRPYAGMAKTGVVTGVLASETVPPPAWSFGDKPEIADELLDLVLAGTKTATTSPAWEYEDAGEPVPQVGELSILLDGERQPRALIRTTSVETVPFDEVDEETAAAEGEDDRTLDSWRTEHEKYFRRNLPEGREFADDMPLVVERFELLYPRS
ncbi:ASCH domain-containing protein [Myceligenerans salitolerans]|nr:ASCH domain-containing protein [Myceligenerans salitolerans]